MKHLKYLKVLRSGTFVPLLRKAPNNLNRILSKKPKKTKEPKTIAKRLEQLLQYLGVSPQFNDIETC